jgi:chemotaxis protein CheD
MRKPAHVIEIFLQPGEFYFGDETTRIRTLLGSCVAITMWHPRRRIGGMCHYMLPSRNRPHRGAMDGRYADEALGLFLKELDATRTRPEEYEVKLFGGGDMFPKHKKRGNCVDVPCRNVAAGRLLVRECGFAIKAEDLGGLGHRQIIFDVWSGHVWVRQNRGPDYRKEAVGQ